MEVYYLFSSVTFLPFYIPLVKESNKRQFKNIFIVRKNRKGYADPTSEVNKKIFKPLKKKHNIKTVYHDKINLQEISGIVFMIDGDIYGPPRKGAINDSLLFKLDPKKTIKISMTEHMNFMATYHHYIDHVDYCIFSNKHVTRQMTTYKKPITINGTKIDIHKSYKSDKNLFLGNTKYDNITNPEKIRKKFNLFKKYNYCLFLYPKVRDHFKENDIINIYNHIRKLGFKIIVKTRPKDTEIPNHLKGDHFVCSDIYPNESLQLMRVCSLCIISSSAANEEVVYSRVPCIDIISDLRPYERNQYLLDNKVYIRIENNDWKDISFEKFKNIYENLKPKNHGYYMSLKKNIFLNNKIHQKKFLTI